MRHQDRAEFLLIPDLGEMLNLVGIVEAEEAGKSKERREA